MTRRSVLSSSGKIDFFSSNETMLVNVGESVRFSCFEIPQYRPKWCSWFTMCREPTIRANITFVIRLIKNMAKENDWLIDTWRKEKTYSFIGIHRNCRFLICHTQTAAYVSWNTYWLMTKHYHETLRATDPPVPVLFLIMSRHGLAITKMRTVHMKDPTGRLHKNVFQEQETVSSELNTSMLT